MGVDLDHAYQWSRTRMGGWAVAQSPILLTTITLERLRTERSELMSTFKNKNILRIKRGYEALLTYYENLLFTFCNEPLYTRPVRTVV